MDGQRTKVLRCVAEHSDRPVETTAYWIKNNCGTGITSEQGVRNALRVFDKCGLVTQVEGNEKNKPCKITRRGLEVLRLLDSIDDRDCSEGALEEFDDKVIAAAKCAKVLVEHHRRIVQVNVSYSQGRLVPPVMFFLASEGSIHPSCDCSREPLE